MGTSFLLMCLKVNRLIEDYAGTAQEPGERQEGALGLDRPQSVAAY